MAIDEELTGEDGRDETPNQRADRNWSDLLQEVRVSQTSTQIIGGFLLAVAFQQRFPDLDQYQKTLYLVLVGLAGLASALALALVMLHRRHFATLRKANVVVTGDRLLKKPASIRGLYLRRVPRGRTLGSWPWSEYPLKFEDVRGREGLSLFRSHPCNFLASRRPW